MSADATRQLERVVVGSLINQPRLIPVFLEQIDLTFLSPPASYIAEGLAALLTDGATVSITTLTAVMREQKHLDRAGGHIGVFNVWQEANNLSRDLETEVALLAERFLLREAFESTHAMRTRLDTMSSAEWVAYAQGEVARIAAIQQGRQTPVLNHFDDWLTGEDLSVEWCVPGLLPKGTATMLTAEEGMGKSTLLRQIGLAAVAGMNPFTPHTGVTYEPQKVLLVDCEVTQSQLLRSLRGLWSYGFKYAPRADMHRLAWESCQQGLNLSGAHDQAWLRALVKEHGATLLVVGPVYRFTDEDLNTEEGVRTWQRGFEPLLAQGVTVLTEHHAPNEGPNQQRLLRPIGSSAMRRWFAQGIALRGKKCTAHDSKFCHHCQRKATVESWRGSRDEEARWPTYLTSPVEGVWWERDEAQEVQESRSI